MLSDEELARVWAAAGNVAPPYGDIVRLLILTGQPREVVTGMIWAELPDDLATWTIPGNRTKNGVPHIVPLSEAARDAICNLLPNDLKRAEAELKERRKQTKLVFPGEKCTPSGGWSKSKANLDQAAKLEG